MEVSTILGPTGVRVDNGITSEGQMQTLRLLVEEIDHSDDGYWGDMFGRFQHNRAWDQVGLF